MKILEYNNNDFLKGISAHANIPLGGLWQAFTGIDPFDQGGLALPSLVPANVSLDTTPRALTGFQTGGASYIYAHSDTKLYQVLNNSPYTVVDKTSSVYTGASGTPNKLLGVKSYKGKYVYAYGTNNGNFYLSAATLGTLAGDVIIHAGVNDSSIDSQSIEIGADNNLYVGDINQVRTITNLLGTSGNTGAKYIEDGYVIRELINDGRFLVVIADNNAVVTTARTLGNFNVKIYFWDMVQADANSYITPEIVWTLNDSYAIGGRLTDNGIEIITANGLYITSVATSPKLIRPFPTVANFKIGIPLNPYQLTYVKGSLHWVDGTHNQFQNTYAYGNPMTGQQKIFYNPYIQTVGNLTYTCLTSSGNQIITGTDQPGLFIYNTGTTRGQTQISTIDNNMKAPYKFDYVKVVLGQKLQAGQSVQCTVLGQNGNSNISQETQSYNASNPKQELLFRRVVPANNPGWVDRFEDIIITLVTVGVPIQRFSVYATPADDSNADL